MLHKKKYTDFAIALAWPETLCKQAGAWYDNIMNIIGISKNNYYKVGHAAVVLVQSKTGKCFYFDFGRYHTPFGYGRVRDMETDHELEIKTKVLISNTTNEIENFEELLNEIYQNDACHGTGRLYASYTKINFEKAYKHAKKMQDKSTWKYGPFILNGTNCSRFVRTTILSGNPPIYNTLRLGIPITITPTPIGNVKSLKRNLYIKVNSNAINKKIPLSIYSCKQKHLYTAH